MKILVVDDEKDIKFLFEQKFRKEIKKQIVTFVFAFSGEEALDKLADMEHEAVLILSDINMPGMSGLELLETNQIHAYQPTARGDDDHGIWR